MGERGRGGFLAADLFQPLRDRVHVMRVIGLKIMLAFIYNPP